MDDNNKTKEQLVAELAQMQKRIAVLEESKIKCKQVKEELRLHAAMMDNVVEGVYLIGWDDLLIKWTNEKLVRMFGYDPGEMVGKSVDIVNAPTKMTPAETRISIVDVLKKTGEWHGEVRNIKRDGTHFWCSANVSLFDHPEYGKVMVSVHTDITERKKAEEEMRRLATIVEQAAEGIAVVDIEDNIQFANQAWIAMHGYESGNELVGKHLSIFHTQEQLKNDIIPFNEAVKQSGYKVGEVMHMRKDGTIFPAMMTVTLLKDEQGKPYGLVGFAQDITERKKAEEAMRESKIKLQVLYDSSSDAIMLLDEKGFFDCNDATLRLFGCTTKGEFCSRHHPAEFSPATQPDGTDSMVYAKNNIAFALKEGSMRFEHLHRRLDGSDFSAEVLLDAMVLGGKKVLQARVYDITDRKRTEGELKSNLKDLQQFKELTVDRESVMIGLKKEVNQLCEELGKPGKHNLSFLDE